MKALSACGSDNDNDGGNSSGDEACDMICDCVEGEDPEARDECENICDPNFTQAQCEQTLAANNFAACASHCSMF